MGISGRNGRGMCESVVIIVVNFVVLMENLYSNGPTTLQERVSFKTRYARRDVHKKLNVETEKFKTEPSLNAAVCDTGQTDISHRYTASAFHAARLTV